MFDDGIRGLYMGGMWTLKVLELPSRDRSGEVDYAYICTTSKAPDAAERLSEQ